MLQEDPIATIFAMSGMGVNSDRVIVAFHEDYSAYLDCLKKIRNHPLVIVDQTNSFLIDLNDKDQYLPLTLSNVAAFIDYKERQKARENPKGSDD